MDLMPESTNVEKRLRLWNELIQKSEEERKKQPEDTKKKRDNNHEK